jgi:hypothetical protein
MENSEPKQVCRRNALAFLGYAAVFALTASRAMLAVSPAEAQTTTPTPAAPTTSPTDAPKSGTERRQERRSGRTERRQERRTGRNHHRAKEVVPFLQPIGQHRIRAASAQARIGSTARGRPQYPSGSVRDRSTDRRHRGR